MVPQCAIAEDLFNEVGAPNGLILIFWFLERATAVADKE
jgi:hypothetical protein